MKDNADASSAATSTANAANATAVSANTNANTALNTANNAKDTADAATAAASSATSTANTAKTTADNAARAALSNNVANLAPAYDTTLTYDVGDLVTYVDDNNTGKLYRCIIAVNVPGAFNVNYWDDITTSEAYAPKEQVITTIDNGTKTFSELVAALESAVSSLSVDNFIRSKIVVQVTNGGVTILTPTNGNPNYYRYMNISQTDTRLFVSEFQFARTISGETFAKQYRLTHTPTYTENTDYPTGSVGAGTTKLIIG